MSLIDDAIMYMESRWKWLYNKDGILKDELTKTKEFEKINPLHV